jgi:hypothetical protein
MWVNVTTHILLKIESVKYLLKSFIMSRMHMYIAFQQPDADEKTNIKCHWNLTRENHGIVLCDMEKFESFHYCLQSQHLAFSNAC